MSEFDRVKAEAIAGPHYDGIPEHAKVGGVWGAMRTSAKEAYMAGRAEAAAERTAEIVAMLEKDAAEWDEHGAKFPIGSRDQRDCRMRARYARLRANAITTRWPDAFPKPGGADVP